MGAPGRRPRDAVLLHGVGHAGRQWDFFARAVDRRLRLIAPDARGHGDSAKPASAYVPADFVADALAILDALALPQVVLVGHSMGGSHALAFTLAHPERVSRLVVIDTGPSPAPDGGERARRLTATRPASFADAAEAERYIRATSPGYADEVYAHRVRWLLHETAAGLVWRSDLSALERVLARTGGDLWGRIAEIAAPTLLVRGTRSGGLGADATALGMVERMPDARLLELDAGHNVHLDRPRELADAVVAFARQPLALGVPMTPPRWHRYALLAPFALILLVMLLVIGGLVNRVDAHGRFMVDDTTDAPIPDVSVTFGSRATVTDADGRYAMDNLPRGATLVTQHRFYGRNSVSAERRSCASCRSRSRTRCTTRRPARAWTRPRPGSPLTCRSGRARPPARWSSRRIPRAMSRCSSARRTTDRSRCSRRGTCRTSI